MSIKKINEFPTGSGSLSSDDVFLFMDSPSVSGVTKKITLSQLSSAIGVVGSSSDRLIKDDKEVILTGNGSLTLPSGSIFSETNNTVSLMPPTAQSGQSLVIRPTAAIWNINSSDYIVYGSPITITVNQQYGGNNYFGTVNYSITGSGVTQASLGRALTGNVIFSGPGPETETITWTIPANSDISEFTLTLTSVDGALWDSTPEQNDPALYYSFEPNAMPSGQFVTVTNSGISNSEHSHVHLVAGDPSTVDIYLGDDDQYIKIEKDGGDVVIGTDSNTYHWTFGTNGNLTLPASGSITFPDSTTQTSAGVPSNTGLVNNSVRITNMISISQSNYDSLATKDANTLYIVNG
jgi:hypothetical protein